MLQSLSFGMRAAVASILVHGTIAAVVVTHERTTTSAVETELFELQIQPEVTPVPIVPPPPLPVVPPEPEAKVAAATLDTHRHHETVAPLAPSLPPAAHDAPPPPEVPAVVQAAGTGVASFTMSMSSGGGGNGLGPGSSAVARPPGNREADIVDLSGPSALADRVYGPTPVYPREAQDARIEGDVPLLILVDTTGRVTDVRVQRHAGYGLDQAAVEAVRQWTFKPRTLNGQPVAVRVQWTMKFRLD